VLVVVVRKAPEETTEMATRKPIAVKDFNILPVGNNTLVSLAREYNLFV
jgi:hypothetical protein